MKAETLQTIADRLSASRAKVIADARDQGITDGAVWAAEDAEWQELAHLDDAESTGVAELESMEDVVKAFGGEPSECDGFLDTFTDKSRTAEEEAVYCRAFVMAAAEVFRTVRSKLH